MPLVVGTRRLQTLAKTEVTKADPRGYTNAGHTTVCLSFIGFSSLLFNGDTFPADIS